ncbi:MAG: hypothetical protein ACOYLR_04985 [Chlorobium sp.]
MRPLFLLVLAVLPTTFQAEGRVLPVVTVTPDTVLVGDRIDCLISVKHSSGEVVSLEGINAVALQPFELVSSKRLSPKLLSGITQDTFELELVHFGAGKQTLPFFTVLFYDAEGRLAERLTFRPSASVYVRELTDASMRDLRPIKPPLSPSIPYLLLLPALLGVSGVGVIALLLIFFLKRTVRNSAERVDSGQVAQRKLRKLGTSLSAGMPPHECYEELSNIMRSFLETHYRISALEAVTQEIERDLKKLGVAGFESIMNLLKQADLVKFADSRPDVEESRQSLHKASEVIRSTRRSRSSDE